MNKSIPGGLISRRGIAVQMKDGAVIVSSGDIKRSIDTNADQWWNLFVQNQDNIDNFFESVVLHNAVPSTVKAGHILFPSDSNQGWLREIDLSTLQNQSISEAIKRHQCFDYEGRILACPQDHSIRAVELCRDPGEHYGPWQILSVCSDGNSRLIGGAETFEGVIGHVDAMLEKGKPDPLPSPRDDGLIVVELPKGLTGVIDQKVFYYQTGTELDFTMTLMDHELNPLMRLNFGDRIDTAIRIRDDHAFRDSLLKESCPSFDTAADNSALRKPYDEHKEKKTPEVDKGHSFPDDIPF